MAANEAHSAVRLVAEDTGAGERLDVFLASRIQTLSRARLQELIRACRIRSPDGGAPQAVTDPSTKVRQGDAFTVEVPPVAPYSLAAETLALKVLYEDESLIVIDKPAGLVVHPGVGNPSGTLVNALLAHCGTSLSGIGGVARPGIVHRLDKDTSGVMVVAKTDTAHRGLAKQFADHGRTGDLRRDYIALVWGEPKPRAGRIGTLIGRHPASRIKMAVVTQGGRAAITNYSTERTFRIPAAGGAAKGDWNNSILLSVVRCSLETGRTHQVRVHMAYIGTPIIGDAVYGAGFKTKALACSREAAQALSDIKRQALHALSLRFKHPVTGKIMTFESAPPGDVAKLCKTLEGLEAKLSKN